MPLARRDTGVRAVPPGRFFHLPKLRHQLHRLGGDLGAIRGMELVELAPAMGPTAGQYHTSLPPSDRVDGARFRRSQSRILILAAGGFPEGKRTLDPLMPSLALDGF